MWLITSELTLPTSNIETPSHLRGAWPHVVLVLGMLGMSLYGPCVAAVCWSCLGCCGRCLYSGSIYKQQYRGRHSVQWSRETNEKQAVLNRIEFNWIWANVNSTSKNVKGIYKIVYINKQITLPDFVDSKSHNKIKSVVWFQSAEFNYMYLTYSYSRFNKKSILSSSFTIALVWI